MCDRESVYVRAPSTYTDGLPLSMANEQRWHKVSFVIAITYIVFLKIDIGKLSARLRWSLQFVWSIFF